MNMNKKELEAFAKEAAKGIKTPEDLNEFSQMLKKITVEAALNAEMDEHLGYEKNQKSTSSNSRNGKSSKRVKTEDGEFELDTPLDREGSFEPKLVKKHQSRFTSMDDKILWLYAQGMSTREIVNAFDEWYGAEISPTLVSLIYLFSKKQHSCFIIFAMRKAVCLRSFILNELFLSIELVFSCSVSCVRKV